MIIRHNISAMNARRRTNENTASLSKNLQKLASGYQVNCAADDAGGLSISEKMRAQITGLNRASLNSQEGVDLVQIAEGAMSEDHSLLQRMNELALQSMNGTWSSQERQALDAEYQNLVEEIDRIGKLTNFNGITLMDGSNAKPRNYMTLVREVNMVTPLQATKVTLESQLDAHSTTTNVVRNVETQAVAANAPAPPTTPASFNISGNTLEVTSSGTVSIPDGFTGTVKIPAGSNVLLTSATPGATLQDITIECGNSVDLHLQDLNIKNTVDMNAIDFKGTGNTLNLIGNNSIISTAQAIQAPDGTVTDVKKALVHVPYGTELTINGSGSLTAESGPIIYYPIPGSTTLGGHGCRGAIIGSNEREAFGDLIIAGGNLDLKHDDGGMGAVIGNGDYNKLDTSGGTGSITILDGTIKAELGYASQGSCIGGSQNGKAVDILIKGGNMILKQGDSTAGACIGGSFHTDYGGSIIIEGGTIEASNGKNSNAAVIGTGGDRNTGTANLIIRGGTITAKSGEESNGAVIGAGNFATGGVLIEGGTIYAESGKNSYGAVIGGGRYGDGGDIVIDGGNVTAKKGEGAFGAAFGGGSGCYGPEGSKPDYLHPGNGGHLQVNGGTATVIDGWIGGGLDHDSCDFGTTGSVTINGGTLHVPPFIAPTTPPSHFANGSPDYPWSGGGSGDDEYGRGGLILQIGTDNEEYDRLRVYIDDLTVGGLLIGGTNVLTQENATKAMSRIKYAMDKVSLNRGQMGAYQNRLHHNLNVLQQTSVNTVEAESRIRDTDMAKEMMKFTKNSILSQASQAMTAQAGQMGSGILELLK